MDTLRSRDGLDGMMQPGFFAVAAAPQCRQKVPA